MRWLSFALVGFLLLSGCGDKGADTSIIDPKSEFGAISGVVVDAAVRPLMGVQLQVGNATTTSDENGGFTFTEVTPGIVEIKGTLATYLPGSLPVEVKAGQVTQAKMILLPDPAPQAYKFTLHFAGRIEAAASIATFATDLVLEELTGEPSPLCSCTFNFTAEPTVVGITYEATWKDTLANPTEPTDLYYELYPTNNVTLDSIQSGFETNPIHHYFDRATTWDGADGDGQFTARLTGSALWVNYQQPYDIYVTLWYHAPPADESWSFVAGDM